jgi:hypothetical protein
LWEDFNKPKLIYPETTQGAYFAYDANGFYADKTCFILISEHSQYLQSILSSKLYEFAYKKIFSSVELGDKGYQYNKHALVKLPVLYRDDINADAITDNDIYQMYRLSNDEIEFIERQ